MPYGDGTGPNGQGPLTGRGFGRCGGGYTNNRFYGRGHGFRRGYGMGFGYPLSNFSPESEKSWIENAISAIKNQLQALEKRKSELDDK